MCETIRNDIPDKIKETKALCLKLNKNIKNNTGH